jgi:hypothetical protein
MSRLTMLLDMLEVEYGPGDPLPSTDGWELVLAETSAISWRMISGGQPWLV